LDGVRQASGRLFPDASFAVAWCGCMERTLPDLFGGIHARTMDEQPTLSLAKNETEMLQLLFIAGAEGIRNLRVELDAPKGLSMSAVPVGHVNTTVSRAVNAHLGRYPDPILEFAEQVPVVAPNEIQSWVLRCKSDKAVAAGTYSVTVRVASEKSRLSFPMSIRVYDFQLPDNFSLRTAVSVYGSKALGKNKKAFERWILKNYHLNPFSIYSEDSYGEPVLPDVQEYVDAVKDGLNFIPLLYLKLPRQALHSGKGVKPAESKAAWDKMTEAEKAQYPPEWLERYKVILRERIPALKAAGLYHLAVCYGFDEASPSEWPAVAHCIRELKAEFPELRILTTAFDASFGMDSPLKDVDEFIPYVDLYDRDKADKARKCGKKVWYYTTRMTIDGSELCDIRAQLGTRAFANRVDGWLVWTVSRWNDNRPIESVPETGWNPESYPGDNGGGSYFCIGKGDAFLPTLRSEAIRDGIEDYEYFAILKRKADASTDSVFRQRAQELLGRLSVAPLTSPDAIATARHEAALLLEGQGAK